MGLVILIFLASACQQSDHPQVQGYVEGENIFLASPYSGLLLNLAVQRGQLVKKGQLLFQLDELPQRLEVQQGEADLLQAQKLLIDIEKPRRTPEIEAINAQIERVESNIELAAVRLKRITKLYEGHVASKDALDEARANYESLMHSKAEYQSNLQLANLGGREDQIKAQRANVAALVAKVKDLQWQLEQKRRYAPADGVIFDTYYSVGEFVNAQQPVISLLTPANTRVVFFVPVEVLATLRVGQTIRVSCDGCAHKGEAKINYISPEAEYLPPLIYSRENNDKIVFRIKAQLQAIRAFKPGQPVMVQLP